MEAFNTYCVVIGVAAIGIGFYVLFTKKLMGRNTGSAKKETILKFLPIEVGTYISEGLLLILMGLPQVFPFTQKAWVTVLLIGVSIAIVAFNAIMSKKYFPDARAADPKFRGPRLR